ncbi:prolyl oligopeptidase family serine peptidase [Paraglaciecola sp. 2405UD69-4]|uniref:prolyl oligopeptidase family serine peptidase n=1 Tax=Paraglaciecola sp. 2405UD69-4 TaxID=3391836 RepID=UPI0039C8C387
MHANKLILAVFALIIVSCSSTESPQKTKPNYPDSKQHIVIDELHGHKIADPFRWLEEDYSPETRKWIESQQVFAEAQLSNLPTYSEFNELLNRMSKSTKNATPLLKGDYLFVWKHPAESNAWKYFVKDKVGKERVLLDPYEFSNEGTARVEILDISSDGKMVAYGLTLTGADEQEVRFRNVVTGKDLKTVLPYGLYNQLEFKQDGSGFFYVKRTRDESELIYEHRFGTKLNDDKVIFGQGIPLDNWIAVNESKSGRYQIFSVEHGWSRSDLYLRDVTEPNQLVTLVEGKDGQFNAWFIGERLFIFSNFSANNGEVFEVDLAQPEYENWKVAIKENSERVIDYVSVIDNKHAVTYLHNVQNELHIFSVNGALLEQVPIPKFSSITKISGNAESDEFFFGSESFLSPRTTFKYKLGSEKIEVYSKDEVAFNSEAYEVKQFWISSKDNTKFPIFLMGKKGFNTSEPKPTILYGYGGFAYSIKPRFSTPLAAWLEMGGLYAIANIRGGAEFGKEWHRQGQLANKQNVFDDFIAAASWLKSKSYTSKEQLSIQGASNGGLLVASVITQVPDLANAVVCQVPDLDMIGYYRFKNNNAPALLEYGNASIKTQFEYLIKYSPYQAVEKGVAYPAIYISSGDFDTRVPPLQARKMTAKLQQYSSGDAPIVLKYDEQGGHTSGGSNTQKALNSAAEYLAFMAKYTGLQPKR